MYTIGTIFHFRDTAVDTDASVTILESAATVIAIDLVCDACSSAVYNVLYATSLAVRLTPDCQTSVGARIARILPSENKGNPGNQYSRGYEYLDISDSVQMVICNDLFSAGCFGS
ncbi:hypothetical protein Y032_0414g1027 [Ancylostoma ceylanicum]|uniref:Uncharacterized protein n=1 Tax=Ancylostoma ceylanicum TaxID=53326 RepID=A0A016X1X3_9BILA|nr:hypothetical protein Y032_0414g1027 [Ancylostoma ceylanicum]